MRYRVIEVKKYMKALYAKDGSHVIHGIVKDCMYRNTFVHLVNQLMVLFLVMGKTINIY